jgi:phenylacetate-CoA ligase
LRDVFLSSRLLSAFELNEATMSHYLDILERGGCHQIFGYPSAIYLLCLHARNERRNLRCLGVKVVFVTGEVLFPYQREVIAETLNCPVANGYGGRDSALIAHECPQGGMHVLSDAVILEIIDPQGRPAQPGEPGEVVITDLYSHEAPFIRYATGDIAMMSSRRCPCGRALPLLEAIDGRSNDSIVAPDGRIINSLALIYSVREIEGIERFRICQKSLDRFHMQLVRNQSYPGNAEERIRRNWVQLLRSPLHVTFEYVSELALERSGKFRHIVSELPAGQSLRVP